MSLSKRPQSTHVAIGRKAAGGVSSCAFTQLLTGHHRPPQMQALAIAGLVRVPQGRSPATSEGTTWPTEEAELGKGPPEGKAALDLIRC